ncbi:hypothetical protein E4T66_13120 [Sinimarinibacterium sp. CAU 1509]|uniref:hypothetical protein n=1 Tax=Sinimarinibacterium sp. CAU 1509 TaxID=2562283 RepID=UPI0010ABEE2D|nr:hypothetical protein [Sinimarinibacterium sp. CAU 1509]TJY59335.1 hypothetical protein E4T66_13120 [Sinimarinibacterium sp. CAU 1509]
MQIASRYCGPPQSGNGGYTCGLLAEASGEHGAVEVTLKAPPPLDCELQLRSESGVTSLWDGEQLIAEARAATLPPPSIEVPSLSAARAAVSHYGGREQHLYPSCFTCGPHRAPGDGLCLFTGTVADGVVAAPWCPSAEDAANLPVLWAAIDCAGYWACAGATQESMLLGRMTAVFDRRPQAGQALIVVGRSMGREGRKVFAQTALFTEDGHCLGHSLQTWISLQRSNS